MRKDEQNLLNVLRSELKFLENGGTRSSLVWRPRFIFEGSAACVNTNCNSNPSPCGDCFLLQLVPPELRAGIAPCRHGALHSEGQTPASRYPPHENETEQTLLKWLAATIVQLENQTPENPTRHHTLSSPQVINELPLCQNPQPKCANPACSTAFSWLAGGKFFRFTPDQVSAATPTVPQGTPIEFRSVHQYWLCEGCSHLFTLASDPKLGVVLKLKRSQFSLGEARKELLAPRRPKA
jgi:hypothetical protein